MKSMKRVYSALEGQRDVARGAVTVLRDDQLGRAQVGAVFALGLDLVHASVDEHDDVGVLLDGARFAKVGQHRALLAAHLHRAGQLRQRDDGHVHLLRQHLEASRDLADLDGAVAVFARLRRGHELQVVDDDDALLGGAQLAAGLGAQLQDGQRRRVVDEHVQLAQRVRRVGMAPSPDSCTWPARSATGSRGLRRTGYAAPAAPRSSPTRER